MSLFGMLLLGLAFLAGALTLLLYALGVIGLSTKAVRERLAGTRVDAKANDKDQVRRAETGGPGVAGRITPKKTLAKIERNIVLAGRPDGWTVRRVAMAKIILTSVGVLLLYTLVSNGPTKINYFAGIGAVVLGYMVPSVLIQKRAEARQATMQQELPDVLDQVTISIESGLGFEAAFARIGERRSGPLAEEIMRTVQDMRLGMSRRDAYQALAERTDFDDLRRFVKSIVQAEQYGVSISSVVRTQAVEMRFKRRARAEAMALKVPVKILFPLLVCILPVLFIVVLTPAVISMSESFANR